jgi:error-prone DNA polymerase
MPEQPQPKARPHPFKSPDLSSVVRDMYASSHDDYVELMVSGNFSFLEGASHGEELVTRAAELGCDALALTDRHTVAGVVRAHMAAKEVGVRLIVGTRLTLADHLDETDQSCDESIPRQLSHFSKPSPEVLIYPMDRAAYGRMCRLLTLGKRRAEKGECRLAIDDLLAGHEGLVAIAMPPCHLERYFTRALDRLRDVFGADRLSIGATCACGPDDAERLRKLADLSRHTGVPMVAGNDVRYHEPGRRMLHDVLRCIHHGCTIEEAGLRLAPNAERHLKSPAEMAQLFAEYPAAIARTRHIEQQTRGFSLDQLRYEYPDETCPSGTTPMQHLVSLTRAGAAERYPNGVPENVHQQILHEFELIDELHYAPYFLTVHDLVMFARSRGILCQGRGAAANSAVCYCLGVTAVDPGRVNLLFERFISRERNEPPDIDIDFEHERREEVIQYIYRKYGRDRAALTAEVITYRRRSAVRDVGKALGLSLDCVDRLARNMDWWGSDGVDATQLRQLGLDPADPTMRRLATLMRQIIGFPRHLSQHVGGFVMTRTPLCELVPIENAAMEDRTVIEWDKDDIDAMGMLKVDVLGLGMLTCIRKCFSLVNTWHGCSDNDSTALALHNVPPEDPSVYDMICEADTVGVFQIESRAQMSMLPRLKPRCYYDLVIEVAIVRPGPIQGDMVHPYLRRRNGEEPVKFPGEAVRDVLGKTLGVPLFQEQAMALAVVCAGFTPGEADQLRRAIAAWKSKQKVIFAFGEKLVEGMVAHGYDRAFAEQCFNQIKGFSEYGFPESHAASFALLVYVSAWLKRHHPAAFAAALINSQPMGFYAPAQIVRDAQQHGVTVRPIDVNHSRWDCTLEPGPGGDHDQPALRLGMRLVRGLRQRDAQQIEAATHQHDRFHTIESLWRAAEIPTVALRRLAAADAFGSMELDRRQAQWQIRGLRDQHLPLFDQAATQGDENTSTTLQQAAAPLPPMSPPRQVMHDYASHGLSLKDHPMRFLRRKLHAMGATPNDQLLDDTACPNGRSIRVAGIVLVRQRPGTASGIIFMTLEDECGIANLVLRPHIYDRFRRAARHGVVIVADGKVERQGRVVHVLVERVIDLGHEMTELTSMSRDFH